MSRIAAAPIVVFPPTTPPSSLQTLKFTTVSTVLSYASRRTNSSHTGRQTHFVTTLGCGSRPPRWKPPPPPPPSSLPSSLLSSCEDPPSLWLRECRDRPNDPDRPNFPPRLERLFCSAAGGSSSRAEEGSSSPGLRVVPHVRANVGVELKGVRSGVERRQVELKGVEVCRDRNRGTLGGEKRGRKSP
eukprot:29142-Pelagococcus_subviridis.AAC.4